MIDRFIFSNLKERLFKGKAVVILGPRQVGKTTLVKHLLDSLEHPYISFNGDEPDDNLNLSNKTSTELKNLIGNHKIIFIDEAQSIPNIGTSIKLLVDNHPDIQVIATGSSSFELSNHLSETLTGRKYEFSLYPFSLNELIHHSDIREEKRLLSQRLVFGTYPTVINDPSDAIESLKELSTSYLFKDVLKWEGIRKPRLLETLLQALAFQIGDQVSYNELSRSLQVDNQTVEKYIDILEKAFIIFRLPSFSKILRSELKKSKKIYFWDNGIRNAVIANFANLEIRADQGKLWENYIVSERMKHIAYSRSITQSYFWRTHAQQEIDLIEIHNGRMDAYEMKFNSRKVKKSAPKPFRDHYPQANFTTIHPENYIDYFSSSK